MKVRFLQVALLLSLCMGNYALSASLVINGSLTEVPSDIEGYDFIYVQKDCEVNSIKNDPAMGTHVKTSADLTVNSDLTVRQFSADVYNVQSAVKVQGDLNVISNDNYTSRTGNGTFTLGNSQGGKHELIVDGHTTLAGKYYDASRINKTGTLTTKNFVVNTGLIVEGTVYADDIVVGGENSYFSVTDTGHIKANDGKVRTITVNTGASFQVQQRARVELDMVIDGGQVKVQDSSLNDYVPTLQDVTMNGGEFLIKSEVSTGDFTVNEGTLVFDFTYGKTPLLNLNGNSYVLGENVAITLQVDSIDNITDEYALFANAGSTTGLENLEINIQDLQNTQTVVKASLSNGTVVLIPEPATASLSLLALACLAARRRRR